MPAVPEPTVSVIMGVRNGGKTLTRAIDSILGQTFFQLEFIICNDGSSDDTEMRLRQYEVRDNRVCVIGNKTSRGLAAALNQCLKMARGSYIARMDADDFSYPDRIMRQISYLDSHPDIAFVGCCAELKREDTIVGNRIFPERPVVRDFYMTQPYLHPTLIFRREVLAAAKGYSEDKRCVLCEDYDLLLRLYAKGFSGANLREVLFTYTLPATAKGNRTMGHRWNEAVTRWRRFKELGILPAAVPYVIKPLAVGLLPEALLKKCKP